MAHYKPKFKYMALWLGGKPPGGNAPSIRVNGTTLTYRAVYVSKHDAQEAAKFYKSIGSKVRVILKGKDNYKGWWVYAGR